MKAQYDRILGCINEGLSESEKFNPKELIFDNEMALSVVFERSEDAEKFWTRYRDGRAPVSWVDTLGGHSEGVRALRVERDAGFDQRFRGQMYYNLKQNSIPLLSSKAGWSSKMEVGNSGIRGVS